MASGMTYREKMDFTTFISDAAPARGVLAYEIWRLGEGPEDFRLPVFRSEE